MWRTVLIIIAAFLAFCANAESFITTSLLPTIDEYHEALQRAEKVPEHYLEIGFYTENDRYQRRQFLKKLEKNFKNSQEKPLLMVESHLDRVKKKSKYCIKLLTDRAIYCNIWLVDYQSTNDNGIYMTASVLLTAEDSAFCKQLLQKPEKPTGTFDNTPYFYSESPAYFVTIFAEDGKKFHSFAVPSMKYCAVAEDPYYPAAKEYYNIARLYQFVCDKLSNANELLQRY